MVVMVMDMILIIWPDSRDCQVMAQKRLEWMMNMQHDSCYENRKEAKSRGLAYICTNDDYDGRVAELVYILQNLQEYMEIRFVP